MAKKNAKGTPDVTTKAPTRQMWRRSVVVLVVLVGFCFSAIVGRLAVLQIVQTDEWQQRAVSQQLSDSIISPKRGTIYDTNMNPLAQSATVWTVIMSPKDIPDDETRTKIADELSVLLDVDRDKLLEQTQKTNSQYEVVKAKIELPLRDSLAQWVQDNELTGVFRTCSAPFWALPGRTITACTAWRRITRRRWPARQGASSRRKTAGAMKCPMS